MAIGFFRRTIDKLTGREIPRELSAQEFEKYIDGEAVGELCATEYYLSVAISLIASLFAKCPFRTCIHGEEKQGEDYYLWNIAPNHNESGSDLKKKIAERLLWDNECLIVQMGRRIYVADSFYKKEDNPLKEKVFSGVTVEGKSLGRDFKMSDVVYLKNNNVNIRALLNGITDGYKKIAQKAAEDYESANGRKGILNIDTMAMGKKVGGKSFEEIYEDLINNRFKRYFTNKNAVLPLFEGYHYTEMAGEKQSKSENKPADYDRMIQGVAGKVALALHMSPKILTGDVEGMGDAIKLLLSFCIDPLAKMVAAGINRAIYGKEVLKQSYLWVSTKGILHIDVLAEAEKIDRLIACGHYSIDETRILTEELPLNTEESRAHFITKNYEKIGKGGNDNGGNRKATGQGDTGGGQAPTDRGSADGDPTDDAAGGGKAAG